MFLRKSSRTLDVDYTTDIDKNNEHEIEALINDIAHKHGLDVEPVPIDEFVPLPPEADSRKIFIGTFGNLDVYIFDLYTIALSKIARGFDADFEDIIFLLSNNHILWEMLERFFYIILPEAPKTDIDRNEFIAYFKELKRRMGII